MKRMRRISDKIHSLTSNNESEAYDGNNKNEPRWNSKESVNTTPSNAPKVTIKQSTKGAC